MLATLVDEPFSDADWVFEPKYDGVRALAFIEKGKLELVTRNGLEVSFRYPELRVLPQRVKGDAVIDGEIIAASFQQLQQRVGLESPADIEERARLFPAQYAVFDLLWYGGEDRRGRPLSERRAALERAVVAQPPLLLVPQIDQDGEGAFRSAVEHGREGIIAKEKSSPYYPGRSKRWLKIKAVRRQQVVIGGWTDPRRTRPLLGALIVGLYADDGRLHWAGNVGGGFTRESLEQVHALLQSLPRGTSPFAETVLTTETAHWVEPRLVAEVKFGEWTREGYMRRPVFEGLRDDKKPEECRLEREQKTESVVLEEYRKKRRFERTPEPAGEIKHAGEHRFVVQEHDASVKHFDFRLEIGGVLKSWSVPKGPSLDPTVKRLAVQVEDHPVEYLTFTGQIPEGSYGAGTVSRWDSGTFDPIDEDPLRAWSDGAVKFRLHGQRLKGEWRLVEMKSRRRGGKALWLLFKVDDEFAVPGDRPAARRKVAAHPAARPRVQRIKTTAENAIPLSEFLDLKSPEGDRVVSVDGHAVPLTSLDRVYWPQEGITKFDLLGYYVRAWPRIEPFLRERPAILHRYPRGIAAPKFFQHDLDSVPEFVKTHRVGDNDYAVYTDLASLLYLVNLGTIEHHPWHSRINRLDSPDWLALDLDPGRAPWENVIRVAQVLRKLLEERQITGFVKTSGSKGLHVFVPLKIGIDYAYVSKIAHELASEAARRQPDIATVERSISGRGSGQVYVDWLQNARGKSIAAPFSVRARPAATVSLPIRWDDLPRVKISDYTIRNANAHPDVWEDFFQFRQEI